MTTMMITEKINIAIVMKDYLLEGRRKTAVYLIIIGKTV